MSKLSPYNLSKVSAEAEQFRDELTNLWNLGKYASPILKSAPTWSAVKGETAWVMPDSGGTSQWVFRNTAWVSIISVSI